MLARSALVVVTALAGCDGPTDPLPTPKTVVLSADSVRFEWLGQSVLLQATVRDENGRVLSQAVAWSSEDTSVATVDGAGRATAVGNGVTAISARVGSARASARVSVEQRPSRLELSPDSLTFTAIGDTVTLEVTAVDEGGSPLRGPFGGWSSSDTAVVQVDSLGRAVSTGAGAAQVSLEMGGQTAGVTAVVRQDVAAVRIEPDSLRMTWIGATAPLTAVALDANGFAVEDARFGWQASDTSVTTVDSTGVVVARATGTAAITATVEGSSDTAWVVVAPEAVELTVTPTTLTLTPGAAATLVASVRDAGGAPVVGALVAWSSSDAAVASVDTNGRVTAAAVGLATVTASSGGLSAVANVTVEAGFPPLTAPSQISAGGAQTCALQAGVAYCWGQNNYGQLGTGDLQDRRTPVPVATNLRFSQISAGAFHTCAVATTSDVYCWGYNLGGQVGDGTTTHRSLPVKVVGGHSFTTVETGTNHTCGLATAGEARCWGWDVFGMLGQGVLQASPVPQPTPGLVLGSHAFASIGVGPFHTCATTPIGTAYCWGQGSEYKLSTTSWNDTPQPVLVVSFDPVLLPQQPPPYPAFLRGAALGSQHSCVAAPPDLSVCWGKNDDGQLGRATHRGGSATAYWVDSSVRFTQVTAANNHTCGLDTSGVAWCWGDNYFGQLGDGTTTAHTIPAVAMPGRSFSQIDAGYENVCGILTSGGWLCWGSNSHGQLGTG